MHSFDHITTSSLQSDVIFEFITAVVVKLWCVCVDAVPWRRFSPKLRSMCHCLYQVVSQRFQQSTAEAVWTVVGTVIFLRFINPAIGTIYSSQSRCRVVASAGRCLVCLHAAPQIWSSISASNGCTCNATVLLTYLLYNM